MSTIAVQDDVMGPAAVLVSVPTDQFDEVGVRVERPVLTVRDVTLNVSVEQRITYQLYYVTGDEGIPHLVEWLLKQKCYAYDIETGGPGKLDGLLPRKGFIATMQFGNPLAGDKRAYVVDVRTISAEAMAPVLASLHSRDQIKLGQNMKFECKWTQHRMNTPIRNVMDTQVAELVCRAGLFEAKDNYQSGGDRAAYKWCSMAKLAMRYLGLNIDKDHDLRTGFWNTPPGEHNERQLKYAAGDVIYPFYIAAKQKELIAARALGNIIKIEFELIPILADAELTGLKINVPRWRELWQESIKLAVENERALDHLLLDNHDLFGGTLGDVRPLYTVPKKPVPVNYGSPTQKPWIIKQYCERIGWSHEVVISVARATELKKQYGQEWMDWQTQNGKKRDWMEVPDHLVPEDRYCLLTDSDKNTLKLRMLRGQLPKNIVQMLLSWSTHEKRASSFGMEFLKKNVDELDDRLRTEIHQCATATGRMSTTPNTQNIPGDPRWRACFIPGDGYKFVIADYSQIEPRLSAQVSKDPTYLAAFLANDDIYLVVATEMFGYRPDKTTPEGAVVRQIAKIIVLALAYRMGAVKLRDALTLGLEKEILSGAREAPTLEEAKDLWEKFFAACTGVKEYQELMAKLADPKESPRGKLWDDFLGEWVTWAEGPCGRKRFFPPSAWATYTEGPNAPIQGSSATITKAAAVLIQRVIDEEGYDAHLINAVHDELVYEVRADQAEAFKMVVKECMERAGQWYVPDIPVIAEFPENSTGVLDFWAKKLPKPTKVEQEAKAA